MAFFKKKEKTKEEKSKSPYLQAREEWLERYGTYIKQAHNWRLFSFIILITCMISLSMNVMQVNQTKVIPYIVEVDKLGHTNVVARADTLQALPKHLIPAVLASCITDWRTVTADIELQKRMISKLSYFFTSSAKNVLKEWYEANNPYNVAKKGKLVHVEIKSLPLPISENSYRIEWTEKVRSHTGSLLEEVRYEATITVQIQEPQNVDTILNNPAGIYITAISATQILSE